MSRPMSVDVDIHLDETTTEADLDVFGMHHDNGVVSVGLAVKHTSGGVSDHLNIFGDAALLRHIHTELGRELDRLEETPR